MRQYLFLIAGLFIVLTGYAQTPTITMVTNKAIGDTISLTIKGEASVDGAKLIDSFWIGRAEYELSAQTITISGEVQTLVCANNELISLDVSESPDLEVLNCSSNLLKSLDVSKNKKLQVLYCISNELSVLDVSGNPDLESLDCTYNQLTSLNVAQNLNLNDLTVFDNNIESLDLSGNLLLETLWCFSNPLKELKLSNNEKLNDLICDNTSLTSIDISGCTNLIWLSCKSSQLKSIDLSNNLKLCELYCDGNQLTHLDLSNNKALYELDCGHNPMTHLDVSENVELSVLNCYSMGLSTLDLSKNKNLNRLYCYNNNLKDLNLSYNEQLRILHCFNNEMTSLDVSGTSITALHLYGNPFSACGLDSIFSQLRELQKNEGSNMYSSLRCVNVSPGIFIKNGDLSTPGTDGCREYIATDKNWKVFDYNSGNSIEVNNSGRYSCGEIEMSISDVDVSFSIYPNPVYDELYIKGSLEVKSVAVYSLAGKLCKQVRLPEGTNNYSLSFSGLNAGIYILLIETPNGIKSQKVIKM